MLKSVLRAGLIILIHVTVVSVGFTQLTTSEIDKLVADAMETFNVAGVAVGIVKDGEVFHAKGYGVRSVETQEEVDKYTAFTIASNSKAFTAAALAILVEKGQLSWQDKVVDHIPEFKMYNDYVTLNITIQDLITHRSGLGLGAGDLQKWPSGSDFTMKDILTNFQYFEPVSAFRTQYDYDNILYLVAGEVIKRVTGLSWEEFVRLQIMEPLGMKNSFTLPPSMSGSENLAAAHLAEDGELKVIPYYELDPEKINGAAGGILSNAADLCQWMLVHLNEGNYGKNLEKQLFTGASQREMWKIHTPRDVIPDPRYNPHYRGYGLGWRVTEMNGKFVVFHTGDLSGMLSKTILIPDLDLGVVVLTNSYYGGEWVFEVVSQTIVDSYLGLELYDWTAHYLEKVRNSSSHADEVMTQVWKRVESASDEHIQAKDYSGIYKDNWFGKVKIYQEGDQLWFSSLRSPKLTGPMYYYRANTFAIKWVHREMDADAFAIFCLDEEGKATGITMKGISPEIDFSYDFQDLSFSRE